VHVNQSEVLAQRVSRNGNSEYLLALPIAQALELLDIPDPTHPFPDNRRVSKPHAIDFGNYWEKQDGKWLVPPLLLDYSKTLQFERLEVHGSLSNLGFLMLPSDRLGALQILDGQHRVLGWYLKKLELNARLSVAVSDFNKNVISKEGQCVTTAKLEITYIKQQIDRFNNEYVSINLLDGIDSYRHRQFFVDIAKNALGINKTVQAKFDTASIINRVTQLLIKEHPLLRGRVDLEKTSCSGHNPNILTVVNVADIVRHVSFGISARMTTKKENTFQDDALYLLITRFLDLMQSNVPQLQEFMAGETTAQEFREKYLLGSGTIWRCLAGVYHELCVVIGSDDGYVGIDAHQEREFAKLLSKISGHMKLPISSGWFATTLFPNRNSKAPSSRAQDLTSMVDLLRAWAIGGELFIPKKPKKA